jgi:8-hydroxy-5-deazaflavin:NADPH oxidoreductase
MRVTIIGAGNMARGIGSRALAGGNEVDLIDHDPEHARALADELGANSRAAETADGDVVVLAVPYEGVADAVAEHKRALVGKVVVDIANPVDWSTMDRMVTPEGSSAAEELAKRLPEGVSVVKAFNTTFAGPLVAGEAAGQQLDVLIAGDDDQAKRKIAALVEAGGMRAIDVGPLIRARQLEQMQLLHIALQERLGSRFRSALKLHW